MVAPKPPIGVAVATRKVLMTGGVAIVERAIVGITCGYLIGANPKDLKFSSMMKADGKGFSFRLTIV